MLRILVAAVFVASALHAQTPQPAPPAQQNGVTPGPQQPLVPNTPANMPPQPAEVTYQNGLLSVRAENSTLADVLTQIQSKTGAQIQVPPGASAERVVIQQGPAPTRTVLDSLLHGSGFDYIIVGSMQDPQLIQRVVLTPHVASAAAAPQPAYSPRRSQPAPDQDDDNTSEQPTMPIPPAPPQPAMQPGGNRQPGMQPMPGTQQPGQPSQDTNSSSGGIKTPEQLLQELQQIQRGQQQPGQTQGQPTTTQPQTPPQMPPRRVPVNPPS